MFVFGAKQLLLGSALVLASAVDNCDAVHDRQSDGTWMHAGVEAVRENPDGSLEADFRVVKNDSEDVSEADVRRAKRFTHRVDCIPMAYDGERVVPGSYGERLVGRACKAAGRKTSFAEQK